MAGIESSSNESAAVLDEIVRRLMSVSNRAERGRRIAAVAEVYSTRREVLPLFNRIRAHPNGKRMAVEFVARMPLPIPNGLILLTAPLLSDREVVLGHRMAATAKLIASLPDKLESVGPIVRSFTAGLGRIRTLERLTHLQSRIDVCTSLDEIVAQTEATTKMRCPKCSGRFTRPALIRHLWSKHRLLFANGRAAEPAPAIEKAVQSYATSRDTTELDQIYFLTKQTYENVEPAQVHQALLTRIGATAEEIEPVCRKAAESHSGICPTCFAMIRNPVLPLPEPLVLADGRVSGDGFFIEASRGTYVRIVRPGLEPATVSDPGGRLGPRELGVKIATGIAVVGMIATLALPKSTIKPLLTAFLAASLVTIAYATARYVRRATGRRNVRAIDAAWREVAGTVGRTQTAIRFLTRLCRTSLNAGTPLERSTLVRDLAQHAAVLSQKGNAQTQLFAAVRVLQASDTASFGTDWGTLMSELFAPFCRGESSPVFAEAAAETLLNSEGLSDRETARLRILLANVAFESRLTARDLVELGKFCPQFSRLLAGTQEWFQLLGEVWKLRNAKPWGKIGNAQSVFEHAKRFPSKSGRTLVAYPDTLLVVELEDVYENDIGPVLVGRRGVTVADRTVADPDAEVRCETTRNGTHVLVYGTHTIGLNRKLPTKILQQLQQWLRFRADRLMPAAEASEIEPRSERVETLIAPSVVECPMCGTRSYLQTGEVGIRI